MGSDDLFKKRKEQKAGALKRQARAKRAIGRRYLIVSEGFKTEPYYFEEFRSFHKIRTSRVTIVPSDKGSSPKSVLEYAIELFDQDAGAGADGFDKVFCVIDRDRHETYSDTILRIKQLNKSDKKPFVAITSIPCFEYWLLLHFGYTRQAFSAAGKNSVCDCVIHELRKHSGFSAYQKGQTGVYNLLMEFTQTAIGNAKLVEKDAKATGQEIPSTLVHHLISELLGLVPANDCGKK